MTHLLNTAVVVGAGCAGIAMAQVLADFARQVIVIDPTPDPSNSVQPQRNHSHILLGSGADALFSIFPNISFSGSEYPKIIDPGLRLKWISKWGKLPAVPTEIKTIVGHRDQILGAMNVALRQRNNIRFDTAHVESAIFDQTSQQFTLRLSTNHSDSSLIADLLVDATGYASKLYRQQIRSGLLRIDTESYDSKVSYSSVRLRANGVHDWDMLMISASPPRLNRSAIVVRYGDDQYLLTMCALLGEKTPGSPGEIADFVKGLCDHTALNTLLRSAEIDHNVSFYGSGTNRLRNITPTTSIPYYLVGDGLVRLNPYHGSGMTLALHQAAIMKHILAQGLHQDSRAFYRMTMPLISKYWKHAVTMESSWDSKTTNLGSIQRKWRERTLWLASTRTKNPLYPIIIQRFFHRKWTSTRLSRIALMLRLATVSMLPTQLRTSS